jgi:folate-dependent phosphoribosylglycinamide formyltransferase PurN
VSDWVQSLRPDFVVLYGTSIIKDPLLSAYDGRMINIHLGLSPYYRGTGTNFWPLVDRCPECVGATIHLAVLKVDAGAILRQVRPDVQAGDGAHALGTKTIIAAVNALPSVIGRFAVGELEPQTQDLSTGKVFRRKDFNADAVRTLWDNLSTGMIEEFLSDRIARLAKYPIVE